MKIDEAEEIEETTNALDEKAHRLAQKGSYVDRDGNFSENGDLVVTISTTIIALREYGYLLAPLGDIQHDGHCAKKCQDR